MDDPGGSAVAFGTRSMLDRERQFLDFARECDRRAAAVANGPLAAQFRELALQWRRLAGVVRDMADDAKTATEFFKSGQ